MSKWLCFALLTLAALTAQAAPPASAEDDMARFMADRGLLTRIDEVRARVADRTSELVLTSMGFLGVPYKRGGNDAESGFDCSGFVRSIYERTVGLVLPRLAKDQAAATQPIDKRDLQPGDLVFFNTMKRTFSHVGIYVGEGKFIHSPKPGAQVRVENMHANYWEHRFDGARRVVNFEPPADAQP
ncbi:MAG TPA: C40 family peptidase [Ramlibacter sp.]|nr:C40 family peptidase [Ramlibacter sp.]